MTLSATRVLVVAHELTTDCAAEAVDGALWLATAWVIQAGPMSSSTKTCRRVTQAGGRAPKPLGSLSARASAHAVVGPKSPSTPPAEPPTRRLAFPAARKLLPGRPWDRIVAELAAAADRPALLGGSGEQRRASSGKEACSGNCELAATAGCAGFAVCGHDPAVPRTRENRRQPVQSRICSLTRDNADALPSVAAEAEHKETQSIFRCPQLKLTEARAKAAVRCFGSRWRSRAFWASPSGCIASAASGPSPASRRSTWRGSMRLPPSTTRLWQERPWGAVSWNFLPGPAAEAVTRST